MTTTFQDNETVTLADLNNIAVDLGDTTFSAFSEEKFGVDELNQITADLVTAGILRTEDNGELGLEIGCKPVYENGIVTIGHGTIVFGSGAKTYIKNPIEIAAAAGSYIYVLNDVLTGKASLQVSDTEPAEGDFVMLAKVSEDNVLIDVRMVAKSRVLSTADGTFRTFTVSVPDHKSSEIYSMEIQGSFSYVIAWSYRDSAAKSRNAYPISDGDDISVGFNNDFGVNFTREGNLLKYRTYQTGFSYIEGGDLCFSVI